MRRGAWSGAWLGLAGIAALTLGVLQGDELRETVWTVCGGVLLIAAHLLNLRARHRHAA